MSVIMDKTLITVPLDVEKSPIFHVTIFVTKIGKPYQNAPAAKIGSISRGLFNIF